MDGAHPTGPGAASPAWVLGIVSIGVVLANLDLFVVNVALPQMAADLGGDSGVGLSTMSWVINGYTIGYASLLIVLGRLADRHQGHLGFLLGVAVFVAASALCAVATSPAMLIAYRIAQAVGAALLVPTSLGLVLATAPPERRAAHVRAWTAIGGLAAAVGPVVGGLLVAVSWRWVFLINVPIGLITLIVGARRLPRLAGHPGPVPDPAGAILVTAGVALLVVGLVNGDDWGWTSGTTTAVSAAAILCGIAFAWRCAHHPNPLLDPGLLRTGRFAGASVAAAAFTAAFGAMLLSIVLWQQDAWGWSALRTGLAVAPGPLMVPVMSFLVVGRLLTRWSPAVVAAGGATVFAAGTLWWAVTIDLQPDYLGALLPGMLLTGIGVGLTLPIVMATATSSLPPTGFATGSGVVNMLRQIGLAIGVAVAVATIGAPASPLARLDAFQLTWAVTTAMALVAAAISFVLLRPTATANAETTTVHAEVPR